AHHAGHVHLIVGGQHRGGVLCFLQPARDGLAQAGHLHPLFTGRVLGGHGGARDRGRRRRGGGLRGGRGCGGGAQHVFLHHATVTAGSLNLIGREALLGHQPVGGRRVLDIRPAGTCRSRRSGGSRGSRIASGGASGNRAEATAGRHGGTGAGDDRAEPATGGRGHFDRDLVGFELAEHFVLR